MEGQQGTRDGAFPAGTLMQGKRGLIMGVANDKSLAWGIAQAIAAQGAELAFTYQGDALLKRVTPLAESVGSKLVISCDVSSEENIAATFAEVKKHWDSLDFIVHAIGFSDKNELKGKYVFTTQDNFLMTMNISCYSFTAIARHALPLMKEKRRQPVDPHLLRCGKSDAAL